MPSATADGSRGILRDCRRSPGRRREALRWRAMGVVERDSTAAFRHLLLHEEGPAAWITLNRPEKRNALSLELMEELIQALEVASASPATRAIVIAGAGPAFSAGHDLGEMVGRDLAFYQHL